MTGSTRGQLFGAIEDFTTMRAEVGGVLYSGACIANALTTPYLDRRKHRGQHGDGLKAFYS